MGDTAAFERSHEILIDTPAQAVYDYVTNPNTWPEWIAASHHIDCPDRPLRKGETFEEKWQTRAEVLLRWTVLESNPHRLWIATADTDFIGPIVVQYTFEPVGAATRYTRTVRNPARPKPPTAEMVARIDAEARTALANIKRNVEGRVR